MRSNGALGADLALLLVDVIEGIGYSFPPTFRVSWREAWPEIGALVGCGLATARLFESAK